MVIRSKEKIVITKPFNIVLVEPEIPPNTGNIARLCTATNSRLHLVHPLGFEINDKHLKRAGLDYWSLLDMTEYSDFNDFKNKSNPERSWYLSTRGEKNIWDVDFRAGDYLIFGSETSGLSQSIFEENKETTISIPMNGLTRSINLANAVGIVLYEALRQNTGVNKAFNISPI